MEITNAKSFFEDAPLYKKIKSNILLSQDEEFMKKVALSSVVSGNFGSLGTKMIIENPSLNFHCPICNSMQTYRALSGQEYDGFNFTGNFFRINYLCMGCESHKRTYFIYFFEEDIKKKKGRSSTTEKILYVKKIGQHPEWSINPEKEVVSVLGEYSDIYRKGLICESQSYGIASFSYYRRIIEGVINKLLDSIIEIIDNEDEKKEYKTRLAQIKEEKNATNRIELAKEILPEHLKIKGMNPLDALYKALSRGLHGKSDEECLEYADTIRKVLVYLVHQVEFEKQSKKGIEANLRKLYKS